MARIDFYFKVEVDLNEDERAGRLAAEICRQIEKVYGVRGAELTNYVTHGDE